MEKKDFFTRVLEITPGFITWSILLFPVVFGIINPMVVAVFIIVFDFYWLIRAVWMGIHLISGYKHIKRETGVDWLGRLQKMEEYRRFVLDLEQETRLTSGWRRKKLEEDLYQAQYWLGKEDELKSSRQIYHVILLAYYKESYDTLKHSILSVLNSDFPSSQVLIVLAGEERGGPEAKEIGEKLKMEFTSKFKAFLTSIHPDGIVGELKAKGANTTWAATKNLKPWIDAQKIPYDDIVVHTFDADTRVSQKYLSNVTYKYIINPDRIHRTYQPIPLYSNNIWEVPAINRLVAFGSSFWQMIESTRPHRMVNFSSQAMSFQTLVDINFWDVTIVSEDSRQFYRAFFAYGGDHQVVPIMTPVMMDAVLADNLWTTLKNQYFQKRRWAWGVEHYPYLVKESLRHPEISAWERFVQIFRVLEGHISWSTASLIIATAAWLPTLFNPDFNKTVIGSNLPVIIQYLLMLTWVGIIVSLIISTLLLPPRPKKYSPMKYIEMIAQWVLIPISALIFGSIPAVEAQTRLAINRPLGFWVTEKKFVKNE